jgi:hypothetical protein
MKKTDFLRIVAETATEFKPPVVNETAAKQKKGYLMTERQIKRIYQQFRDVIKENINEIDFAQKIQGVYYKFAEGVEDTVQTTIDPVRDPENAIKHGEQLKQTGETLKQVAEKMKNIKSVLPAISSKNAEPASNNPQTTPSLFEYVESEILPTVVEIIKQSENPRATKKELLEMFRLNKKTEI